MNRLAIVAASIVFLAITVATGCGPRRDAIDKPDLPEVPVIRPQRGEAIRSITLPGDLVGYYESTLYAKVTGYLRSISVDKGDWVTKGQVLAEIEVPELEQSLDRARAILGVKRVTYERLERVWNADPRLVAREDVDIARGKFQEAKAEVDRLTALVGYTRIVAPFDGVITGRFVDPGALVKSGGAAAVGEPYASASAEGSVHPGGAATPVLSEAMIKRMRVYVYVPEGVASLVRRGEPARLTVSGLPNRVFHGKVTRFSDSLDLATRTMLTEVDLENPTHRLYPGMYANVTLDLERHANALKLPDSAVGIGPHGSYVFEVRHGKLRRVSVTTGINTGTYVEIKSGLSGNEQIIATVSPTLVSGERVKPVLLPAQRAQRNQGQG